MGDTSRLNRKRREVSRLYKTNVRCRENKIDAKYRVSTKQKSPDMCQGFSIA